ncbi:MAG: PLP-dependent aminotransferase family protein [Desulfovibrionaceae bacterium]
MNPLFAARMRTVPRSFIREILKVTEDPEIISFAGGLPNPASFPVADMERAAAKVLGGDGPGALQYSTSEGFAPLREFIAARYRAQGLDVAADEVLITTGSQQGLDLLGKVFLDKGDVAVLERPGYLGAIQAFSVFEPTFRAVPLQADGPDMDALEAALDKGGASGAVKMFYAVTNFQNPSGLSYSAAKRKAVAELLARRGVLLVEDNPYGELRFMGEHLPPAWSYSTGPAVLLGTFSKVAAPGLRIGWAVARSEIMEQLVTVKQAADLHSSTLTQRVLHRYLESVDLDTHIASIRARYGMHRNAMVESIARHFPAEVACTSPEGGMFLWCELPEGVSCMALFDAAIARKVAFVPGLPFYVDGGGDSTFRLNFSNSDPERIETGIRRLGECIKDFLAQQARA